MTSFHNEERVHNQAGVQTNYGPIYHGPVRNVHYTHSTSPSSNPSTTNDDAIGQSLAFPQMLDRRSNVESPYPNTCRWILGLDEYKTWTTQPRGLLWIKGKPGSGKSTLMAFLFSKLTQKRRGGSGIYLNFFFSARGTEMQRTPLGMLRSLLNQLFTQDPAIRPLVRRIYKNKQTAFGGSKRSWEWQQPELESLLTQAITASGQQKQVTIFVDALDEAGELSARKMAAFFHTINDRSTSTVASVKTCISCRHYPILATVRSIEICVEKHNGHDVAAFIQGRLNLDHLMGEKSTERKAWRDLQKVLLRRAAGVFQWAHLVVPLVEKYIADGESPEGVRARLRHVPEELGDVYQHILQDVIDRRHRPRSFLLFQWVCLAEQPLSVTEIRYALAATEAAASPHRIKCCETSDFVETDERMKKLIKTLSGGLAEVVDSVQGSEEFVQVIHQSVNDYLFAQGLVLLASFEGNNVDKLRTPITVSRREEVSQRCQATLYRSCLNCLSVECGDFVDHQLLGDENGEDYCHLIEYAVSYLFIHAEKAASHRFGNVEEEIKLLEQFWGLYDFTLMSIPRKTMEFNIRGTTLLHAASAANLADMVKFLVRGDVNVNEKDSEGNTALHRAGQAGHTGLAQILLKAGANLQARNKTGRQPLGVTVAFERLSTLRLLLHEVSKTNGIADGLRSALQTAAALGNLMIIKLLIDAGVDVNAQGERLNLALLTASYYGHLKTVRLLLDRGADANAQGGDDADASAAAEFYYKNEKLVRTLLDRGADADSQEGQRACHGGNENAVRLLLDRGAEIVAQGDDFADEMRKGDLSHREYHRDYVKRLLLNRGSDVTVEGWEFPNALQAACFFGHEKVVRMLLDSGADLNAERGWSGNALQVACSRGNEKTARMLLDAGADVNPKRGCSESALQVACSRGNEKIVRMLLDRGADVNLKRGRSGSPLQIACCRGHEEIVRMLLDSGADVDGHRGQNGTALQMACSCGRGKTVRMLLDRGADPNAPAGRYGTALAAAQRLKRPEEIVKLLLDRGAKVDKNIGPVDPK